LTFQSSGAPLSSLTIGLFKFPRSPFEVYIQSLLMAQTPFGQPEYFPVEIIL